jgi:hypothetical protein
MHDCNAGVSVLEWARRYVAAGLSVIPVRRGGSKAPVYAGWREYSDRLPTDDELVAWFKDGKHGIGVPGGKASGNLAVMDFEFKAGVDGFARWSAALSVTLSGMAEGCPVILTPSGGRHIYVRLPEPVPGGVLAKTESGLTLIEVRGAGNFVVAPGSPADCHESGKPYTFEKMGWLKW